MKTGIGSKAVLAGIVLTLGTAGIGFAQSASQSMHNAGEDTENAAVNVYHGTKTAVKDTDVTTKVKLALHDDALTKDKGIHVKTVAGIVTLRGRVASNAISERAEKVARDTTGVKGVRNDLRVSTVHASAQ
ncbi:MAG TPA: BON domain-containing protein [Candidatus Binataceae bacterium]|nr:BON domain-containing protein [Candidatus Binataceae bacterium]